MHIKVEEGPGLAPRFRDDQIVEGYVLKESVCIAYVQYSGKHTLW